MIDLSSAKNYLPFPCPPRHWMGIEVHENQEWLRKDSGNMVARRLIHSKYLTIVPISERFSTKINMHLKALVANAQDSLKKGMYE